MKVSNKPYDTYAEHLPPQGDEAYGAVEEAMAQFPSTTPPLQVHGERGFPSGYPVRRDLVATQMQKGKAGLDHSIPTRPGWLAKREPIDYGRIVGDSRLILFCDKHDAPTFEEDELILKMQELKKAGINHLGMEWVPSSMQNLLDEYFSNPDKDANIPPEIVEYIKRRSSSGLHAESARIADGYLSVIRAARNNRIRIVGIEAPWFDFSIPSTPKSLIDFMSCDVMKRRNEHWAAQIKGVLDADDNNRMIVLGGSLHFGEESLIHHQYARIQLFLPKELKAVVVSVHEQDLEEAIEEASLFDESFMIQSPKDKSHLDYYIHRRPSDNNMAQ